MSYIAPIHLPVARRRAPHVPRVARVSAEPLRCIVTGAECGTLRREVAMDGRVTVAVNAPGREIAVGRGRTLREAINWLILDATGQWTLAESNGQALADLDEYLAACGIVRA